jgi:type IV pilus assembly protein PilC
MPRYFYTAKSLKGESKSGVLEAKDIHQLAQKLHEQGFILIKAETEEEKTKKEPRSFFGKGGTLPFFGKVSLKEKMFFTRNLQVMISAGLPLPRALETLASQAKSKKFKKTLSDIKEEIVKGKSFSEALALFPDVFSELFQSMVKVGEESGTLEDVLKILAQQMEKENELKSKIIGAMIYPAVIICAMIGVGILMLVMVIPKLAKTFEDLQVELPATTKLVIALGNFLVTKWYLVILIFVFLIFFFSQFLKTKRGKEILDIFLLKVPIISPIIRESNSASFTRTLSSLSASGVPLVRSLEIVSGTLGNVYFKGAIIEAVEKVRKGEKLSEALKSHQDIYPPIVVQMIAVGEETGETSNVLAKLANFFEEEVGRATENLASVIEPVIMLIIGAAVGFFAISMIQPMYSMLQAIK